MEQTLDPQTITVEVDVTAPVESVWHYRTDPHHVTQWNAASDERHTTHAENDLRVGGTFCYTMAAKDSSASFDFQGNYTRLIENSQIDYTLVWGRQVSVRFSQQPEGTHIRETFAIENINSVELQKHWWQAILNNFKRYVEQQ